MSFYFLKQDRQQIVEYLFIEITFCLLITGTLEYYQSIIKIKPGKNFESTLFLTWLLLISIVFLFTTIYYVESIPDALQSSRHV